MGCVCCSLSTFVSIVLHALERISLCTVCAMLVCCLLFTILSVLVMGIGIGFHYCEVQNAANAMANAAKSAASMTGDESHASGNLPGDRRRSLDDTMMKSPLRSVNRAMKRGFAHQLGRRDLADQIMPSNNNTINDIILGINSTNATLHRSKRDLPTALNLGNETDAFNDSQVYEYYDMQLNSTNETLHFESGASNVSIHDAKLIRENCTLLNFFTRFLQF